MNYFYWGSNVEHKACTVTHPSDTCVCLCVTHLWKPSTMAHTKILSAICWQTAVKRWNTFTAQGAYIQKMENKSKTNHLSTWQNIKHIDRLLSKDGTSLQHKGHTYIQKTEKTKPAVCPPDKIWHILTGCCQKMEHLYSTRDIYTKNGKWKTKPIICPPDKIWHILTGCCQRWNIFTAQGTYIQKTENEKQSQSYVHLTKCDTYWKAAVKRWNIFTAQGTYIQKMENKKQSQSFVHLTKYDT